MSERLDPMYEAEIRERIDRLDDDRVLGESTWLASSVGPRSVLPPEQSHVVEDVLETKSAVIRGSVGVFASKQYAEFTAHARDDIPALLDEIDRLRAALRSATDEVASLDDKVAEVSARAAAVSGSTAGDEQPETGGLWSCGECHAVNNFDVCMVCRAPRPAAKGAK